MCADRLVLPFALVCLLLCAALACGVIAAL